MSCCSGFYATLVLKEPVNCTKNVHAFLHSVPIPLKYADKLPALKTSIKHF